MSKFLWSCPHVAFRNVEVTKIEPTPLRANPLYYQIYCVATNSLVVSQKDLTTTGLSK